MPLPACPPRILRSRSRRINRHAGFTLIEMAVALVVVALLLGSLLAPLSSQVEQRKISEAQKILEQINDALMGFAMSQTPARLPCPDTNGDGLEDACPFTAGSSTEGNVPWQTLAVPAADPWGQRYQYRVNGAFTTTQANGPPYLSLTTTPSGACNPPGSPAVGNIRICVDSACSSTLANGVPAIIYSRGPNGTQPPTSADELENADIDCLFVSRTFSSVTGTEFDDVVTWISAPVLYSRLVTAQKLP